MDLGAVARAVEEARETGDLGPLTEQLRRAGWRPPRPPVVATPEEIRAHVEVDAAGCWLWTGSVGPGGYGRWRGGQAHRLAYEAFVAPIPAGLVVDHRCRVRRCVNAPGGHLEPVEPVENTRRAVEYVQQYPGEQVHHGARRWCVRGHAFDDANTGIDGRGKRYCKTCRHELLRRWRKEVQGQRDRAPEFHVDEVAWLAARDDLVPDLGGPRLRSIEVAASWGITPAAFQQWSTRHRGLLRPLQLRPRLWCAAEARALATFRTTERWSTVPSEGRDRSRDGLSSTVHLRAR